jgi:hypothetical protein
MPKVKRESASSLASNHGKPRKPATAFVMFSNQWREQIKTENPGISFTDIGRKLGEMWREMKPELKKVYQDRSVEAKEKYLAEKQQWLQARAKEEIMSSQTQHSMGHAEHAARSVAAWEHHHHQQHMGMMQNLGVGAMPSMTLGGGFPPMHAAGLGHVAGMHGTIQMPHMGRMEPLGMGGAIGIAPLGMMGHGMLNHSMSPMMATAEGMRLGLQVGLGQPNVLGQQGDQPR